MNKPAVIITRTAPYAALTARCVAALGFTPVLAPLLEAEATHAQPPCPYDAIQGAVFTSAQGMRFLPSDFPRTIPVYAVGDTTAGAAAEAGFSDVRAGGGNAQALGAAVRAQGLNGTWVHIGPETRAPGSEAALHGCLHWPVYRTVACPQNFEAIKPYIQGNEPCFILFHSGRAAATFSKAMQSLYGADTPFDHIKVLCLSAAVLECLPSTLSGQAYVASTPDENALLTLLKESAQCPIKT